MHSEVHIFCRNPWGFIRIFWVSFDIHLHLSDIHLQKTYALRGTHFLQESLTLHSFILSFISYSSLFIYKRHRHSEVHIFARTPDTSFVYSKFHQIFICKRHMHSEVHIFCRNPWGFIRLFWVSFDIHLYSSDIHPQKTYALKGTHFLQEPLTLH